MGSRSSDHGGLLVAGSSSGIPAIGIRQSTKSATQVVQFFAQSRKVCLSGSLCSSWLRFFAMGYSRRFYVKGRRAGEPLTSGQIKYACRKGVKHVFCAYPLEGPLRMVELTGVLSDEVLKSQVIFCDLRVKEGLPFKYLCSLTCELVIKCRVGTT